MSPVGGRPSPALDVIDRLARLAEVAASRGGLHALRRWRPASVAAFRLVRGLVAEGMSFATVIDVGANAGQFSRAALGTWPAATVIAFEPLPDVAEELRRRMRGLGDIEVHPVALGAHDGDATFYRHGYTLSSSTLPVASGAQPGGGSAGQGAPIQVPMRRLDGVLADRHVVRPLLAKLDVQGFELEVLAGAAGTLAGADALVLEQSFDRFYEGQPLFSEVHRFVEDAGWRLVRPLDWRRERGRVVETDCLYVPAPRT